MLNGTLLAGIWLVAKLLIVFFIILSIWYIINYFYINKTRDEFTGNIYEAIVLTNKSLDDNIVIYLAGIMFLVMYLKKNKKSYKLMKKFDRPKFNEFIYDQNCYGLYILGHGNRDRIGIGKGTKEEKEVMYSEFKNAPKKEFVVQLHCNNGGGESLAEILASNKPPSFVSDSYRNPGENSLYLIRKYQPSLKMWIVLLPILLISYVIKYFHNFFQSPSDPEKWLNYKITKPKR